MSLFVAGSTELFSGSHNDFSDNVEPGFVGGKSQHDEIGISSIDAVSLVGIVAGRGSFLAYELHDFMLTLAWTAGIWKYDAEVLPVAMGCQPLLYIVSNCVAHVAEEGSSRGDEVGVEWSFVDIGFDIASINVFLFELLEQFLLFLLYLESFHGCSESTRSLLVHLSSRGHSIDGQVQQFTRSYDIDDLIDVLVDVLALFLKVFGLADSFAFGVATGVD